MAMQSKRLKRSVAETGGMPAARRRHWMPMQRRHLLGLIFAFSAVLTTAGAAQSPSETELQRIIRTKTVRVGAVEASPWYIRDLKTDKWTGVVPEQVELLFSSVGVAVEYVPTQ